MVPTPMIGAVARALTIVAVAGAASASINALLHFRCVDSDEPHFRNGRDDFAGDTDRQEETARRRSEQKLVGCTGADSQFARRLTGSPVHCSGSPTSAAMCSLRAMSGVRDPCFPIINCRD